MFGEQTLIIWMNGVRVGRWTRMYDGRDELIYDQDWGDSDVGRPLSLSLPITPENKPHRGAAVRHFFENLLPDSEVILRRIQSRFGADSLQAFDLLKAIGRDCVGAVQLIPIGEQPASIETLDAEPLTGKKIETLLDQSLSGEKQGGDAADFRISIAGAQEKTALLKQGRKWYRPLGTTPTTHILKLPLGLVGNLQYDMSHSVENEWLCSKLIEAYDMPMATCEMEQFGRHKVLAVERFDRQMQSDGWIVRRPQEDFCQALGVPPHRKYESDGGPGTGDLLRVLSGSSRSLADREMFVRSQILFWMLAATDGHAKNFSIFHERGGTYRLTPLYDVLSAWPVIGRGSKKLPLQKVRMAMAVRSQNTHWKWQDLKRSHWDVLGRQAGIGNADAIIADLLGRTPGALAKVEKVLPTDFPSEVSEPIFAGIEASVRKLS